MHSNTAVMSSGDIASFYRTLLSVGDPENSVPVITVGMDFLNMLAKVSWSALSTLIRKGFVKGCEVYKVGSLPEANEGLF